jgi:cellulose synthase/poly-beta-1,6-N-acetylglucosamine synthase-like glycosyltransferase
MIEGDVAKGATSADAPPGVMTQRSPHKARNDDSGPSRGVCHVAICVCAHNEGQSLGNLFESLATCPPVAAGEWAIYTMASGCSDNTVGVAQLFNDLHPDVKFTLVTEEFRSGKLFSVNQFVEMADADVAIFMDADVCIEQGSLERLVSALDTDPSVGISVARRRSIDAPHDFWGFCEHVQAALHNRLPPKAGRLYAIRTNLAHVDEQAPADDTFQEWACWAAGMRIIRVNGAVVANRGPRTIRDYLRIRRRVIVLHTNLLRRTGYRPATMRRFAVAKAAWRLRQPHYVLPMTGVLALEAVALGLAVWDVRVRHREYVVWPVVGSTKLTFGG